MLRLLTLLIQKNGHLSKTSVMLWIAFVIVSAKYLFAGQTLLGFAFGPFDEMEAISFFGLIGGVYVGANMRPSDAKTPALATDAAPVPTNPPTPPAAPATPPDVAAPPDSFST